MAESKIKTLTTEHINVATNVDAYRCGKVVTVSFNYSANTSTSQRTTYGTLPIGWRPPVSIFGVNVNGNTGYGLVGDDGAVQGFRPDTTAYGILASLCYVTT